MALYLGCPMWGLKTWPGPFFPPGARPREFLHLYSRRLNAVEGNTTFYGLPEADTVARWRDDTPPGFRFCLKFPQTISHHKRLRGCEAETRVFLQRLEVLGERAGPAFLQLPPTFSGAQLPDLAAYLRALPAGFRYAVEPRHADFFSGGPAEAQFDALLATHGLARGIFDTTALFSLPAAASPEVAAAQGKKPRFPLRRTRTAPFAFVRFVGQPAVADNDPWLTEWAAAVGAWLAAGDEVFFFLHNPDDTHAPAMARRFHGLVNPHWPLPPLPEWGAAPAAPSPHQPSLF